MSGFRIVRPAQTPKERTFTVNLRFSGNWRVDYGQDTPSPLFPHGSVRWQVDQFRYMGRERGPSLEGDIAFRVKAVTEADAIKDAIHRVESHPMFYEGFLLDALAYSVEVTHDPYGF